MSVPVFLIVLISLRGFNLLIFRFWELKNIYSDRFTEKLVNLHQQTYFLTGCKCTTFWNSQTLAVVGLESCTSLRFPGILLALNHPKVMGRMLASSQTTGNRLDSIPTHCFSPTVLL